MAVEVSIEMELKITGLGTGDTVVKKKATIDGTTTEEKSGPHNVIIGNSADNLELGHILDTDLLGILIIAEVGDVGVLIDDDGTGVPVTDAAGNLVADEGEPLWLPLPNGLTSGKYIRIIGSSATAAI